MENVLLLYSIILTILLTMDMAGLSLLYSKNKKRVYFYGAVLFLLLIVDNAITNLSEFSLSFEQLYESSDSIYIVAYSVYLAIILVARQMVAVFFNRPFNKTEKAVGLLLPVAIGILGYQADHKVFELSVHLSLFAAMAYVLYLVYMLIDKQKVIQLILIIFGLLCLWGLVDSFSYYQSYELVTNEGVLDPLEYRFLALDCMKILLASIGIWHIRKEFKSILGPIAKEKTTEEKLESFCSTYELTNRQKEILGLIIEGDSNKEISEKLFITEGTVKTHIYNIFKKVDVTSRNQIIMKVLSDKTN